MKTTASLLLLLFSLVGCEPRSNWSSAATVDIDGQSVGYFIQGERFLDDARTAAPRARFIICWTGGAKYSVPLSGPAVTVAGHDIFPPADKPGLYRLRADYSLEEISVTESERTRVLGDLARAFCGPHSDHDRNVRELILPLLKASPSGS